MRIQSDRHTICLWSAGLVAINDCWNIYMYADAFVDLKKKWHCFRHWPISHIIYTDTVCSLFCGYCNDYVVCVLDLVYGRGGCKKKKKIMQCAKLLQNAFLIFVVVLFKNLIWINENFARSAVVLNNVIEQLNFLIDALYCFLSVLWLVR